LVKNFFFFPFLFFFRNASYNAAFSPLWRHVICYNSALSPSPFEIMKDVLAYLHSLSFPFPVTGPPPRHDESQSPLLNHVAAPFPFSPPFRTLFVASFFFPGRERQRQRTNPPPSYGNERGGSGLSSPFFFFPPLQANTALNPLIQEVRIFLPSVR